MEALTAAVAVPIAAVFPLCSAVTSELRDPSTFAVELEKTWLPGTFTWTLNWSPTCTEFTPLLPLYVYPEAEVGSAVYGVVVLAVPPKTYEPWYDRFACDTTLERIPCTWVAIAC